MILNNNILVDNVRLAYRHVTGTSPHTLVFLHGTPSHSMIWRHVTPELEADGHEVLTYDLLGYGASERPIGRDTSVTAQAELLEKLLARLDIDRCTLIAHDIGGAITQLLATRQPERIDKMMLIDSVGYDSWPSATWQEIILHHLDSYAAMPLEAFNSMLKAQLAMTVANPDRMSGDLLELYLRPHQSSLGVASFFEHQVRHYDSTPTQEVAPLLRHLPMPVRILWGQEDRWQPVDVGERLVRDIPDATLDIVPAAGHFLPEDQPARVVSEVKALLASPFPSTAND